MALIHDDDLARIVGFNESGVSKRFYVSALSSDLERHTGNPPV